MGSLGPTLVAKAALGFGALLLVQANPFSLGPRSLVQVSHGLPSVASVPEFMNFKLFGFGPF